MEYLARNLASIREKIAQAEQRAGRPAGSVKLCAVSKTVDHDVIAAMHACGQNIFGENRPQSLRDKSAALAGTDLSWHFIGHLQSNKIKYVYPVAELVHSIDRRELLDQFASWHQKTGKLCPVLLEVHISGEEAKQGFACEEILDVIKDYRSSQNLDIRGLMGMAPFVADETVVRDCFRRLREIFERSRELQGSAYRAEHLSMGMSGDFAIAIAEGATIVRIGTALFSESGD
ncbi:MAG: Pyridoxal phosphate-containing protein YggS [Candidatus Rifleibacterium amylolyticum]|nr:MAG: Pyridoxal phosphate-containing protein YggS [Candidatus Rifleibacterium amylolyticum]